MESEPTPTPRIKSPLPEAQRRVKPMTLHHAGQQAQHISDWATLAPKTQSTSTVIPRQSYCYNTENKKKHCCVQMTIVPLVGLLPCQLPVGSEHFLFKLGHPEYHFLLWRGWEQVRAIVGVDMDNLEHPCGFSVCYVSCTVHPVDRQDWVMSEQILGLDERKDITWCLQGFKT